jgi:hypothetical protein
MSHPEKPTVKLKLAGVTYELLFDFESIAVAEEITNVALISGLYTSDAMRPKISFLRALFFASAIAKHPHLTYEQAKALVNLRTFGDVWMAVIEAWKLSQPDAVEAEEGSDPQ